MIPRPEYPRPQFQRELWMNLNGQWQFSFDQPSFDREITVPFAYQARLSGIGSSERHDVVWYRRSFVLPEAWEGQTVLLHFGAVDYSCQVWVNGVHVGGHTGGHVSFTLEITQALVSGENRLEVRAEDVLTDLGMPRGKQYWKDAPESIFYTPTTGIWQTVWLEFTPKAYISRVQYYPNITAGTVTVTAELVGTANLTVTTSFEGKEMGSYTAENACGTHTFTIKLSEKHLWDVGCGNLYDVAFAFGEDNVTSYFGLREVRLDGHKFRINGRSVFQRLVLDQGFYPDGIYTAPSDEALENDIKLSLAVGFNGARLHEKIFEERFLYHADRLGYIVWGEFPNWGLDSSYADSVYGILPEWTEEIRRDFNHPAIVGWCPYNETWDTDGRKQFDDALDIVYRATKALDPTRPCIDTSGNYHVATDIFCVHDYEQNPEIFKEHYDKLMTEGTLFDNHAHRQTYKGEATFVSEYGGIQWSQDESGWGYGTGPKTEEEFLTRFKGLTDALLDNSEMFGLCYTQLTDVEQEQNGLYTYQRKPKFDPAFFHGVLSRKAAIED